MLRGISLAAWVSPGGPPFSKVNGTAKSRGESGGAACHSRPRHTSTPPAWARRASDSVGPSHGVPSDSSRVATGPIALLRECDSGGGLAAAHQGHHHTSHPGSLGPLVMQHLPPPVSTRFPPGPSPDALPRPTLDVSPFGSCHERHRRPSSLTAAGSMQMRHGGLPRCAATQRLVGAPSSASLWAIASHLRVGEVMPTGNEAAAHPSCI